MRPSRFRLYYGHSCRRGDLSALTPLVAPAEIEGIPLERYIADGFRLKGTERLMQETIEAAMM